MYSMGRNRTTSNGQPKPDELPLAATVTRWHELYPVLSRDFLYSSIASGQLRCLRQGRKIIVPRSALMSFLGEPVAPNALDGESQDEPAGAHEGRRP